MPSCYLLLDFDGVLHPKDGGPDDYFADLPRLEAVLRDFPDVSVVIASSWRHTRPLDALRMLFSADLQARIIGVTPDLPQAPGATDLGTRHREVEAWLSASGDRGVPWLALDDAPHLYDAGAPVILTPDRFGDGEARALREALTNPTEFIAARTEQLASTKLYLAAWYRIAQEEGWYTEEQIGAWWGVERNIVANARRLGNILGVWFARETSFLYPPFQLTPHGHAREQTNALLSAMADNPRMTQDADAGGWTRLQWLYAPRPSLSVRSLADEVAPDGVAPDYHGLSEEARAPAMVFAIAPAPVIALAH